MFNTTKLSEGNLNKLRLYLYIKSKNNFDLLLGGSLSLILQEKIPQREVNDLDVCYHKFLNLPYSTCRKYDNVFIFKLNSSSYWCKNNYIFKDIQVDLFIDNKARYLKYKIELDGKIEYINLQYASEIMEAKINYFHKGYTKHLNDILYYFKQIEKKSLIANKEAEEKNDSIILQENRIIDAELVDENKEKLIDDEVEDVFLKEDNEDTMMDDIPPVIDNDFVYGG